MKPDSSLLSQLILDCCCCVVCLSPLFRVGLASCGGILLLARLRWCQYRGHRAIHRAIVVVAFVSCEPASPTIDVRKNRKGLVLHSRRHMHRLQFKSREKMAATANKNAHGTHGEESSQRSPAKNRYSTSNENTALDRPYYSRLRSAGDRQ